MKVSIKVLKQVQKIFKHILPRKPLIDVLKNIRILAENGQLTFEVSNYSTTLKYTVDVDSEEKFDVLVNGDKFLKFVSKAKQDLEFKVKNMLVVKYGKSYTRFAVKDPQTWPEIDSNSSNELLNARVRDLQEAWRYIACSVGKENEGFDVISLRGKKDEVFVATTDGYRLSITKLKDVEVEDIDLSLKPEVMETLFEISDPESIAKFDVNNNIMRITVETDKRIEIYLRLPNYNLPDYWTVIDKVVEDKRLVLNKKFFLEVLGRVNLFAESGVKIRIRNSEVFLEAEAEEGDMTELLKEDFEFDGEFVMRFNPKFLISVLNNIEHETVELILGKTDSDLIKVKPFTDAEEEYPLYLIVPMRL